MKRLFLFIVLIAATLMELTAQSRPWTRLDGAQVEAHLVDVADGNAVLALSSGRRYPVPIEQLTLADLHHLAGWLAERDYPGLTSEPQAAPEKMTANGREVKIQAERIENPHPREIPDWNPKLYLIEADSSRGYLDLRFPNTLFDSALEKIKSLELVVRSDSGGKSGTTQAVRLIRGRETLATKMGAPRDKEIRFQLDPERFRNRSRIEFEMHCGPDAIVLVSDPAPYLIAVFE